MLWERSMPGLAFYLNDVFLLTDFVLSEVLATTKNAGGDVTQVKSKLFCPQTQHTFH